jgi:4'-phosphopantetheinyl transferase
MPFVIRPLVSLADVARPVSAEVHVWQFRLDQLPVYDGEWHSALLPSEQERAQRYRSAAKGREFAAARGIVRLMLSQVLAIDPRAVEIVPDVDGKPHTPGIEFNVSHSGVGCLIGLANRPVGVDIEEVRDRPTAAGLVERYFAPFEKRQYLELPMELRPAAFLRGWTCKEAVLKADGRGARGLEICAVDLDPRTPPRVVQFDERDWDLTTWAPWPGTVAAVAAVGVARAAEHSDNPPPVTGTRRFP